MENSVLMEVNKRLQNLVEEALRLLLRERLVSMLLHVLLEVEFEVFEDEEQLVLRVDDFFQPKRARQG